MVLRLFILQSHYRSPLDFSDEALGAAKEGYDRLLSTARTLSNARQSAPSGELDQQLMELAFESRRKVTAAMDDDFNTAGALATIFDFVREINRACSAGGQTQETIRALGTILDALAGGTPDSVLGLSLPGLTPGRDQIISAASSAFFVEMATGLANIARDLRNEARAAKNFAQADDIRKRLDEIGIVLEDTPQGTKWRFK
jgi:cysteinyl-tRNA synthetase